MINLVLAFRGLGDTVMTYQIFSSNANIIYLVRNQGAHEFLLSQKAAVIKINNYLDLLYTIIKYSSRKKKNFYNAQGDSKRVINLLKFIGYKVYQVKETQEELASGKMHKINYYSKALGVEKDEVSFPEIKSLYALFEVLNSRKRVHLLLDSAGKEKIPKTLGKLLELYNYDFINYGVENDVEGGFRLPGDLDKIDRGSDVIVCSDSGISHWLSFLGYHVCVVFGPTNPRWTGAVVENVFWFINDRLECVPCQGNKYLLKCNKEIDCINDDKYFDSN